jgi:transcription antitermination factor NusG
MISNHRHWVLTVPPQRELKCASALRAGGYDAWTPVEYRYRRASHHSKRKTVSPYVLLNRYVILAAASIPWRTMGELRDRGLATGYLSIDGQPAALPRSAIERLRRIGDDMPSDGVRLNKGLRVGDTCVIVGGAFTGQVIRARRIRRERATALVQFLGRTIEVEIPLDQLEAA